jgi:hypothetical protein
MQNPVRYCYARYVAVNCNARSVERYKGYAALYCTAGYTVRCYYANYAALVQCSLCSTMSLCRLCGSIAMQAMLHDFTMAAMRFHCSAGYAARCYYAGYATHIAMQDK